MKMIFNFSIIVLLCVINSAVLAKNASVHDSFYDEAFNYAEFAGRISDRDGTSNILKISTENNNVKFFRAGDKVSFNVGNVEGDKCDGFIRDVENNFFVMYVKNIGSCWEKDEDYLRRGTRLNFTSTDLERRIREASIYRVVLLNRKDDFLKQLSELNNFLWAFKEKKVQVASDFDKKILELQKAKRAALDHMILKKKDSVHLQLELVKKLEELDSDLTAYRIEKVELNADRWHMDQDVGVPVNNRPQARIKSE